MKLTDEDKVSEINNKAVFEAAQKILSGGSGQAASWVGPYRPASSLEEYKPYAAWNLAHYSLYLEFIEKEMDLPGHVLELGSASGARSALLARYGNTVVAVEQDENRYKFALEYNSHPNIKYVRGRFPCDEAIGKYNYVFCVSVLYQTGNNTEVIVNSAMDMLLPGGKMFIYDNNSEIELEKKIKHNFRILHDSSMPPWPYGENIRSVVIDKK